MNRFCVACLCTSVLVVVFQMTPVKGQPITIREINPTHSDGGGMRATGGRVNHLGRATDSIVYAASEFGGVFKSTDSGRTWARLDGHVPTRIFDVKASPADPNIVIATSLYDGRVNSLAGINVSHDGGVNWTRPASTTPPAAFCRNVTAREQPSAFAISFDSANPSQVYVGTNCGLAKSSDAGLNWTFIDPGPSQPFQAPASVLGVLVHHNSIIDTCGLGGHRRSTDGGSSWNGAQAGGIPLPAGSCSLAASPQESSVLFATVGTRIFETDNGGGSWTTEFANPKRGGRVPFVVTNKRQGRNFDLWFGDVEIFRATCATPTNPTAGPRCPPSSTWTVTGSGAHADMGEVVFTNPPPINVTLCRQQCSSNKSSCDTECLNERNRCQSQIGQPGGPLAQDCIEAFNLCRTDCTNEFNTCDTNCRRFQEGCPFLLASDGGTYFNTVTDQVVCQSPKWIQSDVTTRALWLWSLSGADVPGSKTREALYMAAQDDGIFGTLDAGSSTTPTWTNPECCDAFDTAADSSQVLYTSCCYGTPRDNLVFRSNPGMTIGRGNQIPNYPPGEVPRFNFPDVIARFGTNRFALVTNQGIFSTQNITTNPIVWTRLGTNAPTNACALYAAGPQTNPTFYALTGFCSGFAGNLMRYFGTSQNGTWQSVPLPPGSNGVGIFAVDPINPSRLFASIFDNNGVRMFRSTLGGASWTNDEVLDGLMVGGGAFRTQVTSVAPAYSQPTLVAFDPNNSNNLLAGAADAGIFLSRDNGVTWTTVTNNSGDSANPVIPRPYWAYFDRECSQYNIYVGTQGRGAWRFTYRDTAGITVATCQTNCDRAATECQTDCRTERDRCLADPGPGGSGNCIRQFTQCGTNCVSTKNACRQRCVDCPQ